MSAETISRRPRGVLAKRLCESTFRANPDYELLLLEDLPAEEQEVLSPLRKDRSFHGLIRLRSTKGSTAKAVCHETARLFLLLQEPGSLPHAILSESDAELTISQLVCDGILQIAHGREWLCGPAACRADGWTAAESSGRILADLSLQALKHAESLETVDAMELSACLYRYNTLPLTPQWLRRIPDGTALEEYLQIQVGGSGRRVLDQGWVRVSPETDRDPWLAWTSLSIPAPQPGAAGYKLYLSPLPSHLRDAFRIFLPAITANGAHHFKVGSNVRGLLRPDKIVAYFTDLPSLFEAARPITKELSGCPAQGVPFTAELECGALISWGSDPPLQEEVPVWLRRQSWRQWISNRLGSALAVAKREKSAAMPAWRFALERLRLEGVNVVTWAPVSTSWQSKPAPEVTTS